MKAATSAPLGTRLDLADLEARGEWIVAQAKEKAARMIADARAASDRIAQNTADAARAEGEKDGYQIGLERGRKEGRELAHRETSEQVSALTAGIGAALQRFEKQREILAAQARDELLGLAIRLCEQMTRRRLEVDPEVVREQVEAAVQAVSGRSALTLVLHPEDEAILRGTLGDDCEQLSIAGALMAVESDESIERGGCVLRDGRGTAVDATISTQLERIARAILPGGDSESAHGVAA